MSTCKEVRHRPRQTAEQNTEQGDDDGPTCKDDIKALQKENTYMHTRLDELYATVHNIQRKVAMLNGQPCQPNSTSDKRITEVLRRPREETDQNAEQCDDNGRACKDDIKILQQENTSIRARFYDLYATVHNMKREVATIKGQRCQPKPTSDKFYTEAKLIKREHANKVLLSEMMQYCLSEADSYPGCGGSDIKGKTIQQREEMCAKFERENHDYKVEIDKGLEQAQYLTKMLYSDSETDSMAGCGGIDVNGKTTQEREKMFVKICDRDRNYKESQDERLEEASFLHKYAFYHNNADTLHVSRLP